MALTERTALIAFDNGLDNYSNPHRLQPATLTQANAVMLAKPGYAAPGPGYTVPTVTAGVQGSINYGFAAYAGFQPVTADKLQLWSAAYGATVPSFNGFPLYPFQQKTQRFQPGPFVYNPAISNNTTVGGIPQMCVSGDYRIFIMLQNSTLFLTYQQISTGAWGPVLNLSSIRTFSTQPGAVRTVTQVAIASDGAGYFYIANGGDLSAYSVATLTAISGNSLASITGTNIVTGLGTSVNAVGLSQAGSSSYAHFFYQDGSNNLGYISCGGGSLTGGPGTVTGATGLATGPYLPISASNGYGTVGLVSYMTNSSTLKVAKFSTATPATVTTSTFTVAGGTQVQSAVAYNSRTGSISYALEYKGVTLATSDTVNFTYNYVVLNNTTNITGWGGVALLGKGVYFQDTAYSDANMSALHDQVYWPVRTGWRAADGTWGTQTTAGTLPAWPSAYLYDNSGNLVARWGANTVGTDSLWPEFASASYNFANVAVTPSEWHVDTVNLQMTLPWPELAYFTLGPSTRLSGGTAGGVSGFGDAGAYVGGQAGLATVQFITPTASRPMARILQQDQTMVLPGALTAYYDGSSVFEAGFTTPTPTLTAAASATGGHLVNGGTYYYRAFLIYQDANGRQHYSQPSNPILVTIPAGAGTAGSVTLSVRYQQQTLRTSANAPLIQIYRTINTATSSPPAGVSVTEMYFTGLSVVNQTNGGSAAAASGYAATVTDTVSDANIEYNTALSTYVPNLATSASTTGTPVVTFAPPPFISTASWNNQLWGLALRNKYELWFTWPASLTQSAQAEGPAWCEQNVIQLPGEIGEPRGIEGLDGNLIIFGSRGLYAVSGAAPPRGSSFKQYGGFNPPLALPMATGLKTLNSITKVESGLLYESGQGFQVLDRSLSSTFVGEKVLGLTAGTTYRPGIIYPDQQCVLLYAADGVSNLMYFYDSQVWSQLPQPQYVTSGSYYSAPPVLGGARSTSGSQTVYVAAEATLTQQQVYPYANAMSWRTPWIEMQAQTMMGTDIAAIAGFGELREVQIQGDLTAAIAHTLTLYTEYDYANNSDRAPTTQTLTFAGGTGEPYPDYQWKFGFNNGPARRVRFTVTFTPTGVAATAGMSTPPVQFSGLMMSYAVDSGLSRLGPANAAGY